METMMVWFQSAQFMVFIGISISLVVLSPILIMRKIEVRTVHRGHLYEVVCSLSNLLGLRKAPKILFQNSDDLNCFVFGITSRDAKLLVSKGTVDLLEQNELEAVILHELSHIRNKDMGLATWGIYFKRAMKYWIVFFLFSMIIEVLIVSMIDASIANLMTPWRGTLLMLFYTAVFPILIVNSSLRNRELLADARVALDITRKDELMSALRKVESTKMLKAQIQSSIKTEKEPQINSYLPRLRSRVDVLLHPLSSLLRTRPSPFNRWIALLDDSLIVGGAKISLPSKESSTYVGILGFYVLTGGLLMMVLPFFGLAYEETIPLIVLVPIQIFAFLLFIIACPVLFFLPNYLAVKNWNPNCFSNLTNRTQKRYLFGLIGRNFLSVVSFIVFSYSWILIPPVTLTEESGAILYISVLYLLVSILLSVSYLLLRLRKMTKNK